MKKCNRWFLMMKKQTTVKDIAEVLNDHKYPVEVWIDAGVLEIPVEEKVSIDIEEISIDLKDEYSNNFLEENGIVSLFYVSFREDGYDKCEKILRKMISRLEGILCADTEDFMPRMEA